MALVLKDRVKVTTSTTGTGAVTLGSAEAGFQDFSVIGDGNTTYYTINDTSAGEWEVGIGTYDSAGGTLSRDVVLESSNSGSLVDFAAGDKVVFVTYPAEKSSVSFRDVVTTNYTAGPSEGVIADTTGGAFTVTLPASPIVGTQVIITDGGGVFGSNNLTVGRNSSTIAGVAQDLVLDINGVSVQFVYDGTTWNFYAQVGGQSGLNSFSRTSVTATPGQTVFNVTYVAGFLQVYLNGVLLATTDYTATDGATVTLTSAASGGDIVEFIAYNTQPIGTAATATNLAGGDASQIPYQSAVGTTAFIPNGTAGQALVSQGASVPAWGTLGVEGGGTGLTSPGTSGNALISDGTGWVSQSVPLPDAIKQPTNVSPPQGATDIGDAFTGYVTLTGSAFNPLYSQTAMAASQWQISTVSDFSTTVVDTGDVAGTAVTYTTDVGLATNTLHYWRVRYKDENGVYSEWSEATSFTTASTYVPPIGEAVAGGFYAGTIVQGGDQYAIIVSPKASGENTSLQWKTSNTDGPLETRTLNNGPAASASMNSATYPAAQFCEGLTIGGFSDWYLPARDELELCYRNLKPTTDANNTSNRPTSAYTYPEGNDLSADTMGVNRNSSPTGAAYTSGDPAQTSVTAFQTGNSEAFVASVNYWSSSEFSSTAAWIQFFNNGAQGLDGKNFNFYVRAVRRVAI